MTYCTAPGHHYDVAMSQINSHPDYSVYDYETSQDPLDRFRENIFPERKLAEPVPTYKRQCQDFEKLDEIDKQTISSFLGTKVRFTI